MAIALCLSDEVNPKQCFLEVGRKKPIPLKISIYLRFHKFFKSLISLSCDVYEIGFNFLKSV
jgi:hypothetical protein